MAPRDKRQSAVKQLQTVLLFIHIAELKAVSEFLKSLLYLKSLWIKNIVMNTVNELFF